MESRAWILLLALATGCVSVPEPEPFDGLQTALMQTVYARPDYSVQPGDAYFVRLFRFGQLIPDYTQQLVVGPRGTTRLLHVATPIDTTGMTMVELRDRIQETYAPLFAVGAPQVGANLQATVQFVRSDKSVWFPDEVAVGGQVRAPRNVPYREGLTVIQALTFARGPRRTANLERVVLLRVVEGKTVTRELDVEAILEHEGDDVEVFPGDIVFVPLSAIAQVDIWVLQYFRRMIFIDPFTILRFAFFAT